ASTHWHKISKKRTRKVGRELNRIRQNNPQHSLIYMSPLMMWIFRCNPIPSPRASQVGIKSFTEKAL
ncbi:4384_t:CDS:1, partial [Funneliformis geosporum]